MGKKEKGILIAFTIVSILLTFAVARSPMEMLSRVGPLWLSYTLFVWYLAYEGEPIWRTILACYGISSIGVISIYFGINLLQEIDNLKEKALAEIGTACRPLSFAGYLKCVWIFLKAFCIFLIFVIVYWPRKALNFLKKCLQAITRKLGLAGLLKKRNHTGKLAKILEGGSIWLILLVFVIPLPIVGLAAIAAMKLKRIKYGLWYLLAANIIEVLILVYLAYSGISWSFYDWFSKF